MREVEWVKDERTIRTCFVCQQQLLLPLDCCLAWVVHPAMHPRLSRPETRVVLVLWMPQPRHEDTRSIECRGCYHAMHSSYFYHHQHHWNCNCYPPHSYRHMHGSYMLPNNTTINSPCSNIRYRDNIANRRSSCWCLYNISQNDMIRLELLPSLSNHPHTERTASTWITSGSIWGREHRLPTWRRPILYHTEIIVNIPRDDGVMLTV